MNATRTTSTHPITLDTATATAARTWDSISLTAATMPVREQGEDGWSFGGTALVLPWAV